MPPSPESAAEVARRSAREAGLVYIGDDIPGISRRRRGKGFSYHNPDGSLADAHHRERAEQLVIPPAWADVWICPDPRGHLQATGRDAAGRKQYRYHPEWRRVRDEAKYSRLPRFGEVLPTLREQVEADLRRRSHDRTKVLALAVRLLDETLIRIGNPQYAEGGSFGLTTLRDRHVDFENGGVRFSFVGKSGKEHDLSLEDRRLARLVKACRDIPGYTLFQYIGEGGKDSIGSGDVNDYLREVTGETFSAKVFRTWGGTVLSAKALKARGEPNTADDVEKQIREVCKEVAEALGNTVAVCRNYYMHPGILQAHREGRLIPAMKQRNRGNTRPWLEPEEAAVVAILREEQ